MSRNQRGTTMIELMVAVGISGAVLATFMYSMQTLDKVGLTVSADDDVDAMRFLISRSLDCDATVRPANVVVPVCATTPDQPLDQSCEGKPGVDVIGRAGANSRILVPAAGKRVGNVELRSCCPGGSLRLEARQVDKLGAARKNAVTGATKTWDSLLATRIACPAEKFTPPKRVTVKGDLANIPDMLSVCPGIFWNVPSLHGPEAILHHYDGKATCPNGYRLISGGADCGWMGYLIGYPDRSGLIDTHPDLTTSPTGKAEDATSWHATCCAHLTNPISRRDRVIAVCEEKPK